MTEQEGQLPELLRMREFVGWDVVDRSGEKVGTVADLLIDRRGMVQFLAMEFGLPRKQVLLPVTQLEWGDRRFSVVGWTRDELRALPPYGSNDVLARERMADLERSYPWMYGSEVEEWRAPAGDVQIIPLSEARDFKVESGAPDLRGWDVFGSDGERIGVVSQLLVDPVALRVRYLDVDVHDDLYLLGDDRHVLIPLDRVDLKERSKDIWVRGLTAVQVSQFPAYPGGAVRPAMERAVEHSFHGV
jgi:sporulation protein YlmC with PRC-barrel domain